MHPGELTKPPPEASHELDLVANVLRLTTSPGEKLPHFPPQTHAERSICEAAEMEPFKSVAEAFENICAGASDNQHPQRNQGGFPKKKRNAKSPLRKTILTRHADYHPSGKRGFTTREVACLQGFPDDYEFSGNWTAKRRQIGNAVPPSMGELILLEIIKSLMETDAKRANGYENTSSAYSESY